ncbi:MAG: M48 family metallopeptidase [Sakamotonia sp.]|jgi:predicted metal-dependent hydrolase
MNIAKILEDPVEKIQKRKTEHVSYELIRAKRKTMALKVSEAGTVTVRLPYGIRPEEADRFVEAHADWIRLRIREGRERVAARPVYTEQEREAGKRLAKELLLKKCRYFAERMGVSYGMVTVREQKTRWGSCSARGNLNFNWKLALMPEEILDYLVVHELAHRVEMNHSPAFWAVVAEEIPDHKTRREWLRQNGAKF